MLIKLNTINYDMGDNYRFKGAELYFNSDYIISLTSSVIPRSQIDGEIHREKMGTTVHTPNLNRDVWQSPEEIIVLLNDPVRD